MQLALECRNALLVLAIAASAGCESSVRVPVTVTLATTDSSAAVEARQVLARRLVEFTGASRRSLAEENRGSTISFLVPIKTGQERQLEQLLRVQGKLRVGLAGSAGIWLTDREVVSTTHFINDDGSFAVSMQTTPAAAQRLLALTAANVGRAASVVWDGKEIMSARIAGAFGETIQIQPLGREDAQLITIVLRSGRLPTPVASVTIGQASR